MEIERNNLSNVTHRRRVVALVFAIVCLLGALVVAALLIVFERLGSSPRPLPAFSLVQFGLLGYASDNERLPHAVELHTAPRARDPEPAEWARSWRLTIAAYMLSATAWKGPWDRNKRWDSDENRGLINLSPIYSAALPDARGPSERNNSPSFPPTSIMAITGPGTAFGDATVEPAKFMDIPKSAIIIVESRNTGIPWPAPGDFDIRTMPETICAPDGKGISGVDPRGFHVMFGDGTFWLLSRDTPFPTLKKLFTMESAKHYDRDAILGPYALDKTQ